MSKQVVLTVPSIVTADGEQFPTHLLSCREWIGAEDVTGSGHGARGAGQIEVSGACAPIDKPVVRRVHAKRARAVGLGEDKEQRAARLLAEWLGDVDGGERAEVIADRLRIAGDVQASASLGLRIQATAARAAKRAGARVLKLRGVEPSATSLDDAAAAAAAAVVWVARKGTGAGQFCAPRWDSRAVRFDGCGSADCLRAEMGRNIANRRALHQWARDWRKADDKERSAMVEPVTTECACGPCGRAARARLRMAQLAGRGAFLSLCNWAAQGTTGDNTATGRRARERFGSFDCAELLGDVTAEVKQGDQAAERRAFAWECSTRARATVARWVYGVAVHDFAAALPGDMRAQARGVSVASARARARVLASVVMGAGIVDACARAGFASVQSFAESSKTAGLWASLQRAAVDGGDVEAARVAARTWGLRAGRFARQLQRAGRSYSVALHGDGTAGERDIEYNTGTLGASRPFNFPVRYALQVRRWRRELARAVELARYWRGVVSARRAWYASAWARVAKGLQSDFGNLRAVLGLSVVTENGERERGAAIVRKSPALHVAPGSTCAPMGRPDWLVPSESIAAPANWRSALREWTPAERAAMRAH